MIEKVINIIPRIFFILAFGLFALAILEGVLDLFKWTLSFLPYQAGRLFEFAGILLIFVIALLLRQIREELKKN